MAELLDHDFLAIFTRECFVSDDSRPMDSVHGSFLVRLLFYCIPAASKVWIPNSVMLDLFIRYEDSSRQWSSKNRPYRPADPWLRSFTGQLPKK